MDMECGILIRTLIRDPLAKRERDAIVLTVLQMLMGGGRSFSAGGPGKGMLQGYMKVEFYIPLDSSSQGFVSLFITRCWVLPLIISYEGKSKKNKYSCLVKTRCGRN